MASMKEVKQIQNEILAISAEIQRLSNQRDEKLKLKAALQKELEAALPEVGRKNVNLRLPSEDYVVSNTRRSLPEISRSDFIAVIRDFIALGAIELSELMEPPLWATIDAKIRKDAQQQPIKSANCTEK